MTQKPATEVKRQSGLPAMRYPNAYVWTIFLATMDIILTALILYQFGGQEVNPIALLVIEYWGMAGAMIFKYCLVLIVIIICETVGRAKDRTGRRLAWLAAGISGAPVAWSLVLLFVSRNMETGLPGS